MSAAQVSSPPKKANGWDVNARLSMHYKTQGSWPTPIFHHLVKVASFSFAIPVATAEL